jgi:uncharacterized protein (DUF2384 family)
MTAEVALLQFMQDIRLDGTALISPVRFAAKLAMEQQELATFAHVHRNTISRLPTSAALQDYLRQSVRVIAAATDVRGDTEAATYWYRNQPLAPFGYKTAVQVVSEGKADEIIRYIESVEAGAGG